MKFDHRSQQVSLQYHFTQLYCLRSLLPQLFYFIRHEEWKKVESPIQVFVCSLCFPLVCTYAISFLMTPFFSFFSAYNFLSLITLKIALTLIPFCCQELVVGAGTGSPLYSSILTFACLSSYRKGYLLQL